MSHHKHSTPARRSGGLGRRALLAAGVAGVLGGGYLLLGGSRSRHGLSYRLQGGEAKPVLDPLQFPERNTRMAYLAAQKHPDVLDQVHCYCSCDRPPTFHKSLLSCFADYHGAG